MLGYGDQLQRNVRFRPIADNPTCCQSCWMGAATTMMIGATIVGVVTLGCATYWAFLRPTKVVFARELTPSVESEAFRQWLGEQPQRDDWFLWGRDMEDRYYLMVSGSVAARRLRKQALSQIDRVEN